MGKVQKNKICKGCKCEFNATFAQKKYCTRACWDNHRGSEKLCELCRKRFLGRDGRVFCSMSCFGLFHRETTIERNIRNRKYPKIEGLSRQNVFWRYNPESRIRDLARDTDKRERLVQHLGGKCIKCGYDKNIKALELDHKKNDGDKDRKKYGSKIYRYYIKHLDEASEKLQILCSNCNKIKAVDEMEHAKNNRSKFLPLGNK